jgi:hypothetical protein
MGGGFGTNLSGNFRFRVQLQKTSGEPGSRCMVGFRDGYATEGDLHMRRLQCAMSEVCGKFKTPLTVIRVFLCNTSSFEFNRDTEEIFARRSDSVSPLSTIVNDELKNKGKKR